MSTARVDTVRLQRISKAFWESAALFSAIELEVFTAIERGQRTVEDIAATLQIEIVNAERLLTVLAAMELVQREGDTFTNAPDVARFLVSDSPSYAGAWMLFNKPRWGEWDKLTEHLKVREDEQRILGRYDDSFDVPAARRYHAATYSVGMGAARRFHKQVDLAGRHKIMDQGGGSGCYCIVGAQKYPDLQAEVLDLAAVVEVTREFIEENGVSAQVRASACDFTRDPLPTDADVAIMASNLPQYSRQIIGDVVQRVYDALLPGGEFHLIGETINEERNGPIAPALWGLAEAVSHSTGLAHTVNECIGYLQNAGFTQVTAVEFIPETLTRITGLKKA
ncbi:MAG: methyltransferase [Pseudomonadales bacterium]